MANDVERENQRLMYGDTTGKILGAAFLVHNSLGKGLTEKIYEQAMVNKIQESGLQVEHQKGLPVFFDNKKVGEQVVDLLVDNKVIVELKAVQQLSKDN